MGLIPYKNEAYLDFSDEKNVAEMQAALKRYVMSATQSLFGAVAVKRRSRRLVTASLAAYLD